MELKCGKNTYQLTEKDVILFNGAAYILMTRKERSGYFTSSPSVGKTKMKQLIKNGSLRKVIFKNPPYRAENFEYYKITGKEKDVVQ